MNGPHILLRDEAGAVLVEIAIAVPVLALLALGSFDVGMMVSRQQELQSSLVEGEAIALATNAGAKTDLEGIKSIISESVNLEKSKITLKMQYRCGWDAELVDNKSSCSEGEAISQYVNFNLTDRYVPTWTKFGVGSEVTYKVERTVQLS